MERLYDEKEAAESAMWDALEEKAELEAYLEEVQHEEDNQEETVEDQQPIEMTDSDLRASDEAAQPQIMPILPLVQDLKNKQMDAAGEAQRPQPVQPIQQQGDLIKRFRWSPHIPKTTDSAAPSSSSQDKQQKEMPFTEIPSDRSFRFSSP